MLLRPRRPGDFPQLPRARAVGRGATGLIVALGTDTFVVRDGKIAVQTFAVKIDPK